MAGAAGKEPRATGLAGEERALRGVWRCAHRTRVQERTPRGSASCCRRKDARMRGGHGLDVPLLLARAPAERDEAGRRAGGRGGREEAVLPGVESCWTWGSMHGVEGRGDTTTMPDLPRVLWRRSATDVEEAHRGGRGCARVRRARCPR